MIFYPLLSLIGIRRPLQKLTIGGILAGVSFVVSAIVEINLEKTYAVNPGNGEAQLRIFNGRNCDYTFSSTLPEHSTFSIKAMEHFEEKSVKINGGSQSFTFTILSASPASCQDDVGQFETFTLKEKVCESFFLTGTSSEVVRGIMYEDSVDKSRRGWPFITILSNIGSNSDVRLQDIKGKYRQRYIGNRTTTEQVDVPSDKLELFVGTTSLRNDLEMKLGGVYTMLLTETGTNTFSQQLIEITEPNSMNMLWLIPQYVIVTLGEVK